MLLFDKYFIHFYTTTSAEKDKWLHIKMKIEKLRSDIKDKWYFLEVK